LRYTFGFRNWTNLVKAPFSGDFRRSCSKYTPNKVGKHFGLGGAHGGRVLRVQIKSTAYSRDGLFTCNVVGPGHHGYRAGVVDFVAVYLVPVDVWYIVPFEATGGIVSLQFRPGKRGNKYSRYMEAWHLLQEVE
jgi:hypothetical protein